MSVKASAGRFGQRIKLGPEGIKLRGHVYPVAGARAQVSDFRSGFTGRKATVYVTITLASGEVLTWQQTDTGAAARWTHQGAMRFVAAVNTAAVAD